MKKQIKKDQVKASETGCCSERVLESNIFELAEIAFGNRRDVARLFLYMEAFAKITGKEQEFQEAVKTVLVNEKKNLAGLGEWQDIEIKKLKSPEVIRKAADEFKAKTGKIYKTYKAMDKSKVLKNESDRFDYALHESNMDLTTNLVQFPGRCQSDDNSKLIEDMVKG